MYSLRSQNIRKPAANLFVLQVDSGRLMNADGDPIAGKLSACCPSNCVLSAMVPFYLAGIRTPAEKQYVLLGWWKTKETPKNQNKKGSYFWGSLKANSRKREKDRPEIELPSCGLILTLRWKLILTLHWQRALILLFYSGPAKSLPLQNGNQTRKVAKVRVPQLRS